MFLDASQRSENPAGAAAGRQESVRKGGGETYTSHPHPSSNGLLGLHLCMGPKAKMFPLQWESQLGLGEARSLPFNFSGCAEPKS